MTYEVRKANGGWHVLVMGTFDVLAWFPANHKHKADVMAVIGV